MSTPTSREPDEHDPVVAPTTPDSAAQTPGNPASSPQRAPVPGTAGQHAAERPYPPSAPPATPVTASSPLAPPSPGPAPGTVDGPQGTAAPSVPAGATSGVSGTAASPPPLTGSPTDRRLVDDRTVVDTSAGGTQVLPVADAAPQVTAPPVAAPSTTASPERETRQSRREFLELPEAPRKPGLGRHLLGILLGLLLTPVALLLTGIGTARLADSAGSGDAATDALGISLLVAGVVLLAVIVLLGVWSPAVSITGGLIWGVALGIAYLAVPAILGDAVDAVAGDRVVPAAIDQLTESAMSGHLLVTGALLVAAGWAVARARRVGRRWAEEVAAAEAARAEPRSTTRSPA